MTSKPRTRGGQAAAKAADKPADQAKNQAGDAPAEKQAKAEQQATAETNQADKPLDDELADNTSKDGEQPGGQPEKVAADGGSGAGDEDGSGPTETQQAAAYTDTLHLPGDPVPDKPQDGMVRPETGMSPPPAEDGPTTQTAAFGDDERNGRAMGIPIDTSGELRRAEGAVPTAAYGQSAGNGHVTGMDAEGQLDRGFGGNPEPGAKLAGGGVRGEVGNGTGVPVGPDQRPTYPSTTLTRSSSSAAPMEPDDVKLATQPKLGDSKTSTDPTMAAATMPSMPGDQLQELVNQKGEAVKPSEFFEVPDGVQGRSMRRVKHRVSEVFTVNKTATPGRRLLFVECQLVPVDVAETLIRLHG